MNIKKLFGLGATKGIADIKKFNPESLDKIIENQNKISNGEFKTGYDIIKKYPRSVSVLGSAVLTENTKAYQLAESLCRRIAGELHYAVVTGGGPGIMEAANKGAFEAGGCSIGFAIKLPNEQYKNKYLTDSVVFEYFFTRKALLFSSAETYVYFPGGFGTMDELFEVLTLMKTGKIPHVPVILVDRGFWEPLINYIRKEMFEGQGTIRKECLDLFQIVDTEDEIIEIIKKAPLRTDY